MKPAVLVADDLFEEHRNALKWQWVAGQGSPDRHFDQTAIKNASSGADLVGYLNYIHPYRVQVLGPREVAYLNSPSDEDNRRRIARIITLEPPVVVVADGQEAPDPLVATCARSQIPLFRTDKSAALVIDLLRTYLCRHFADSVSLHGVFMDILGMGVLLTGESGLGKSELGLELISRGHGLVADDAPQFDRISHKNVEGSCPELLENMLEVRGVGLLDIKTIFGETAVRRRKRLSLIVHLVRQASPGREYERMPDEPIYEDVLGVSVRKVVIEVLAGRNLAVLVEAAVRNAILEKRGIYTQQIFNQRQREAMLKKPT